MTEEYVGKFKIDKEFQNLVMPLDESSRTDAGSTPEQCRDPVITWRGFIIYGYERYELYVREGLPIAEVDTAFDCREAVIAWICAGQLRRTDITVAARRFLTGTWLKAEKARNRKRYGHSKTKESERRIAAELHMAQVSVRRYARYAAALETIRKAHPDLVAQVLSGNYPLSMKETVEIAETNRIERLITVSCDSPAPSIKDMPAYDPDAELTGLTLTAPSWAGSIRRVREKAGLCGASEAAKATLFESLSQLQAEILNMLSTLKEG